MFGAGGMDDGSEEFPDKQGIIGQENLEQRTESVPTKSKPATKTMSKTAKLLDKKKENAGSTVSILDVNCFFKFTMNRHYLGSF